MSFGFRGDQLIPYFHPDDLQERQIKFWLSLRDWIKSNCRPDYAWERLEYYQQEDNADSKPFFSDQNIFKSSFFDTLLLANRPNRFLISDDMFLYTKSSTGHIDSMTTEWYLRKMHSMLYQETLWIELVRINFRGIELSGKQLYQTFSSTKLATQNSSDYLKAMNSFAPRYNPDRNNLLRVVTFLKSLYAENLILDYKRRISRTLFQTALTAPEPIPKQALRLLLNHINSEFYLLGGYGDMVKEDLYYAIETLS